MFCLFVCSMSGFCKDGNNTNQEIKFNIYGEMFHSNGYSRNDILSYIASTREEALMTCKRLNPRFHIMSIWEDHSEVETVKVQSLSI